MELLQEFFVTAFVAILFSYVVAKLVSVAMADEVGKDLRFASSVKVDAVTVAEEIRLPERRVQFVGDFAGEVLKADEFDRGSEVAEKRLLEKSEEVDSGEAGEAVVVTEEEDEEVRVLESEEVGKSGDEEEEEEDWEGIERSELERKFAAASNFVGNGGDRVARVASDVQMKFYGLHRVALEGPCREPQPMALMLSARAKWNAWQKLGNMNPEMAMDRYIALLSEHVPHWMEDNHEDSKLESSEVGKLGRAYNTDLTTLPLQDPNFSDDSKLEGKSGVDVDYKSGGPHTLYKDKEREPELA